MVELLTPLWEIAVSAPLTEVPRGSLDFDVSALPATNPSAADADTKPFEWTKQWYPIAAVEYLDDEKPHAIKLLGMDLVIWNDGAVEGATKTTRCEMAPLSEGRVEETGELLCAYHGWRYDGTGFFFFFARARGYGTKLGLVPDLSLADEVGNTEP
ncbi:hypothetical protein T492DRAFT_587794 [Pavlovales sp. CCMP2436]|nr:hypothetical protein T492DRAFT_587794 [Pavlovales sp. CCMP2436]